MEAAEGPIPQRRGADRQSLRGCRKPIGHRFASGIVLNPRGATPADKKNGRIIKRRSTSEPRKRYLACDCARRHSSRDIANTSPNDHGRCRIGGDLTPGGPGDNVNGSQRRFRSEANSAILDFRLKLRSHLTAPAEYHGH